MQTAYCWCHNQLESPGQVYHLGTRGTRHSTCPSGHLQQAAEQGDSRFTMDVIFLPSPHRATEVCFPRRFHAGSLWPRPSTRNKHRPSPPSTSHTSRLVSSPPVPLSWIGFPHVHDRFPIHVPVWAMACMWKPGCCPSGSDAGNHRRQLVWWQRGPTVLAVVRSSSASKYGGFHGGDFSGACKCQACIVHVSRPQGSTQCQPSTLTAYSICAPPPPNSGASGADFLRRRLWLRLEAQPGGLMWLHDRSPPTWPGAPKVLQATASPHHLGFTRRECSNRDPAASRLPALAQALRKGGTFGRHLTLGGSGSGWTTRLRPYGRVLLVRQRAASFGPEDGGMEEHKAPGPRALQTLGTSPQCCVKQTQNSCICSWWPGPALRFTRAYAHRLPK